MKGLFYGWVKGLGSSFELMGKVGLDKKQELAEWRWEDMDKKIVEREDS